MKRKASAIICRAPCKKETGFFGNGAVALQFVTRHSAPHPVRRLLVGDGKTLASFVFPRENNKANRGLETVPKRRSAHALANPLCRCRFCLGFELGGGAGPAKTENTIA
jgi:hypothetical protein